MGQFLGTEADQWKNFGRTYHVRSGLKCFVSESAERVSAGKAKVNDRKEFWNNARNKGIPLVYEKGVF